MKIAIDESPLKSGNYLSHRVRGTGFYLTSLKESLRKYYPENKYLYFTRGERFPEKPDIVHFPYFEPFFLTLPLKMPKNSIVTVHDMTPFVFPQHFPTGIKGKIKWNIQKMNLRKAAAIITDSEASKSDIIKFTGIAKDKIFVVYLAAAEHFKKKESVKNKFNLPEKFALYVGDITWNKNLPNLIKAINQTKIPLVVVGKAFLNKEYDENNPWNSGIKESQELAGKNLNVIGLGFVSDEDLLDIYNLATVFVIPSSYEGFGLPIVEAMSCGCPVVTTKNGSIPEVAGESVYYVEANSADSIRDGIEKVFNNKELQQNLSEKGMERAKLFSWKKTADGTIKVYKKIIEKK